MKKVLTSCPKLDTKNHARNFDLDADLDEIPREEELTKIILDVLDVIHEAEMNLDLFASRPECGVLFLGDYIKKIQELCSI